MKQRTGTLLLATGFIAGALIGTPTAQAAVECLKAIPSSHAIYVDGQQVRMDSYLINDTTYVQLRDIGKAVGFNVYWDGTEQIDSDAPYTGTAPSAEDDLDEVRQEIIQRINQVRQANGVPFLTINQSLMAAAQECTDNRYTYHHNREECEAVLKHGYPHGFGSNLTIFNGASVQAIAERAVNNWINSPGHFQTMIAPDCDSIGVGVTRTDSFTYCYMFVGNPNA